MEYIRQEGRIEQNREEESILSYIPSLTSLPVATSTPTGADLNASNALMRCL